MTRRGEKAKGGPHQRLWRAGADFEQAVRFCKALG